MPNAEAGVTTASDGIVSVVQNDQLMQTSMMVGAGVFVVTLAVFVVRKLARGSRARTEQVEITSGTDGTSVASSSWELNDAAVAAQSVDKDSLPPLSARTMHETNL